MGTLSAIIALFSLLSGLGSNISGSQKEQSHREALEKTRKENEAKDKENKIRQDMAQRRDSLSRAIGSKNVYAPTDYEKATQNPDAPDLTSEKIMSGISQSTGALANSGMLDKLNFGGTSGINAGLGGGLNATSQGAPLGFNTDANSLNQLRRQSLSKYGNTYGGNH